MKMLRGLLVIAALLGMAQCTWAAPMQAMAGQRLNAAAESFVATAVAASPVDVRSLYRIPDRTLPNGAIVLKPHWPSGSIAPVAGFRGRLNVPVSLLVGGVIVDEVLVQVQVGPEGAASSTQFARGPQGLATLLRQGDPVRVRMQGSGLRFDLLGVVQQPGNAGQRVRVAVQGPYRVLFATIVSDREVTVEPEP